MTRHSKLSHVLNKGIRRIKRESNDPSTVPETIRTDFHNYVVGLKKQLRKLSTGYCDDFLGTYLVVGKTGAGKSSFINLLLSERLAEVGTGPGTYTANAYSNNQLGIFIDCPGWLEQWEPDSLYQYPYFMKNLTNSGNASFSEDTLNSVRNAIQQHRPEALIYCVTPNTLNSQDIFEDLERLTQMKKYVERESDINCSIFVVLTKNDTELGPEILKDSPEHEEVTKKRLKALKMLFQERTDDLGEVAAFCSCNSHYQITNGQNNFNSAAAKLESLRQLFRVNSTFTNTIQLAHLDSLEATKDFAGRQTIFVYALLTFLLGLIPIFDIVTTFWSFSRMASLISLLSVDPELKSLSRYKLDYLIAILFVTILRILSLITYILLPFASFMPIVALLLGSLILMLSCVTIGKRILQETQAPNAPSVKLLNILRQHYPTLDRESILYPIAPQDLQPTESKAPPVPTQAQSTTKGDSQGGELDPWEEFEPVESGLNN